MLSCLTINSLDSMSQFIEMFGNPLSSIQRYSLKKLGDCCELNPRRPNLSLKDTDKVSFVPMPSVSENGCLQDVTDEEYGKVKKGFTYFENGDVLFAKITPCMENGKGAIAEGLTNNIGMGSTEFHVLRPIEELSSPYWLLALTRLQIFRERARKNMTGTGGQKRVPANYLENFMVGLPPIEEQSRFENIYKQADKSGFDGRKSQFIEMFGGGNWPQKTLGEVGSFTRGGGFQKSDFVEHGIPCIHYGQIHTKFGPFITSHITEISSDLESKTKFASKGDLVIAITSEDTEGSCKSTAWLGDYPVAVGGHAAIYKHSMNPLYMSFFFKSTLFNYAKIEYVHGTKVFEIKPDDIAKILVPCPPMSLQNQFSAIAEQSDKSGSVLQYMIAC